MGSEFLNNSLPDDTNAKGSEGVNHSTSSFPYTEVFYDKFPYYLSIGMTEEQYWDKDAMLVKYYRKAEKLNYQRINEQAWLQGMYIYDALLRVAPVLHAFAKKGTKPRPYVEEAYPIDEQKIEEIKRKKEKLNANKALRYMEAYMVGNNRKFKEKE